MSSRASIPMQSSVPWSPRQAICPRTRRDRGAFVVASNGSAGCYGGWDLVYRAVKPGSWARVSIRAQWQDLERGYDSVNVAVVWLDKAGNMVGWEPLFPQGVQHGHVVYEGKVRASDRAVRMALRVLMACSSRGEIRWTRPEVKPASAPKPRRVRLGAAGGPLPPGKRTIKNNTQFYLQVCRDAAAKGIDLLCLPEVMLVGGMPCNSETIPRQAIAVPGKEIAPFQDFAREHKMALCFSVWEKNRELVHNCAILIDKQGEIAGKYRKVHLAQPFEIWWGMTPGHDLPVFDLGWAKVAMNICMDSSAAESARVPARKGAEIICLPIMGDHRASTCFFTRAHDFDVERWNMIQRMRAMDNHVHMVVSRNSGYGTGIFSPRGETLAISGGARMVSAEVDLEDLPRTGHDSTFRGVCWYERREPAYGPLAGELLPDPFAQ